MIDANCPYCGSDQEINHDDGYGYEEGELHEQECWHCEKSFVFTTSISYFYETKKANCLNDGEHNYKATLTNPRRCTQMKCEDCGHLRNPTDAELMEVLAKDSNR